MSNTEESKQLYEQLDSATVSETNMSEKEFSMLEEEEAGNQFEEEEGNQFEEEELDKLNDADEVMVPDVDMKPQIVIVGSTGDIGSSPILKPKVLYVQDSLFLPPFSSLKHNQTKQPKTKQAKNLRVQTKMTIYQGITQINLRPNIQFLSTQQRAYHSFLVTSCFALL